MMRLVCILTLLGLLLTGAPVVGANAVREESTSIGESQRALKELLAQLNRHRKRLREVRKQERRVLGELEGIDRSLDGAERRLDELTVELRQSMGNAQAIGTQLATTQRDLALRRQRLASRIRAIYKYGRTGYLDVMLGAEDFAEFIGRWHLLSTVVHADTAAISSYVETVERYRQLQATLAAEQANLKRVAADTEARRREILVQAEAKRAMLRELRAERATYERVVRELEQNSRDLELLIQRAQSRAVSRVALARGLRGFVLPARGVFTSGFGVRRHPIFGIRSMHTGVDISAPWGSPVAAAADGRVIYAGWFGGYGKIVVLDHDGGVSTLYAHLSRILVSAGAPVRKGQIIGRVGSTGYSTGPHVHFEIRIDGRPIDPVRP